MLRVVKSLLRLVLYIPLRTLRFATKLTVLGCGIWIITTDYGAFDRFDWLIAGLTAFVVLVGIDWLIRWIGKPELL